MFVKRPQHLADSGVAIQQPRELLLLEIPAAMRQVEQRTSFTIRSFSDPHELSEFFATFSFEAFGNIFNDRYRSLVQSVTNWRIGLEPGMPDYRANLVAMLLGKLPDLEVFETKHAHRPRELADLVPEWFVARGTEHQEPTRHKAPGTRHLEALKSFDGQRNAVTSAQA
jgi:hypothetical protein